MNEAKLKNENEVLCEQVGRLVSEKIVLRRERNTLNESNKALEARCQTLSAQVMDNAKNCGKVNSGLRRQIHKLQTENTRQCRMNANLQGELDHARRHGDKLSHRVDAFEAGNRRLASRAAGIEEMLNAERDERDKLQSKVEQQSVEISRLKNERDSGDWLDSNTDTANKEDTGDKNAKLESNTDRCIYCTCFWCTIRNAYNVADSELKPKWTFDQKAKALYVGGFYNSDIVRPWVDVSEENQYARPVSTSHLRADLPGIVKQIVHSLKKDSRFFDVDVEIKIDTHSPYEAECPTIKIVVSKSFINSNRGYIRDRAATSTMYPWTHFKNPGFSIIPAIRECSKLVANKVAEEITSGLSKGK